MGQGINQTETCTDIPECMTAEEIRHATEEDDHLNTLMTYMINDRPATRAWIKGEIQADWPFRDDLAVIDGIQLQGRVEDP